jgi:F-type H+-transporting ATPase subunit delta
VATAALVEGYARAFVAAAQGENALDRVADELYAFARAIERHADLRAALTDAALPTERRTAVVGELTGERAHPLTASLIGMAVEAGHARDLGKIIDEAARIGAAERQHLLAEVRSAVPLTDAQQERLARALSEATGREVEVKVAVDGSLVGGIVARVGDLVFDGTIANRLRTAKHTLGS